MRFHAFSLLRRPQARPGTRRALDFPRGRAARGHSFVACTAPLRARRPGSKCKLSSFFRFSSSPVHSRIGHTATHLHAHLHVHSKEPTRPIMHRLADCAIAAIGTASDLVPPTVGECRDRLRFGTAHVVSCPVGVPRAWLGCYVTVTPPDRLAMAERRYSEPFLGVVDHAYAGQCLPGYIRPAHPQRCLV